MAGTTETTNSKRVKAKDRTMTQLIDDLEQLTFTDFVKIQVDGQLHLLIIAGEATADELLAAWENLLSQFHELVGSKDVKKLLKVAGRKVVVATKIDIVCGLLELLPELGAEMIDVRERVIGILREVWGYRYTFDSMIDADKVYNDLKSEQVKLAAMEVDKEASEEIKPPNKKDYYQLLHAIERHNKISLDRQRLTMYDFALYIGELNEYIRAMRNRIK